MACCLWGRLFRGPVVCGGDCSEGLLSVGEIVPRACCLWGRLFRGPDVCGGDCSEGLLSVVEIVPRACCLWGRLFRGPDVCGGDCFEGLFVVEIVPRACCLWEDCSEGLLSVGEILFRGPDVCGGDCSRCRDRSVTKRTVGLWSRMLACSWLQDMVVSVLKFCVCVCVCVFSFFFSFSFFLPSPLLPYCGYSVRPDNSVDTQ